MRMITRLTAALALVAIVAFSARAAAPFPSQLAYGGTSGGSANAQTISIPNISTPPIGVPIGFIAGFANTGAMTLGISGTVKNVLKQGGSSLVALSGGELAAGAYRAVIYDGTQYQLQGAIGTLPRSYIAGLSLAFNSTTVIGIGAGQAADSNNAVVITLGAFTKSTSGAWAAGSGANGMGNGLTIVASTWYHVCAAIISGTADAFIDTSVTCANPPASTTAVRRIGSFLTDGSSHIVSFFTEDDSVFWTTGVIDVAVTNLGTTAALYTLSVPTGVKVRPIMRAIEQATSVAVIVTSPDETDQAPNTTTGAAPIYDMWFQGVGTSDFAAPLFVYTNTSGQVRARSAGSSTTFSIFTRGWTESRGRLN